MLGYANWQLLKVKIAKFSVISLINTEIGI